MEKFIESKSNDIKYKINKYITLKLENKKTQIYVNGERFLSCKYLLLNLTPNNIREVNFQVSSVDDIKEISPPESESLNANISPMEEFWGHCSNIEAWVENNYDLRLIHTNLGLPLLRKLISVMKTQSEKFEIIQKIIEVLDKRWKKSGEERKKHLIDKYSQRKFAEIVFNLNANEVSASPFLKAYIHSDYYKELKNIKVKRAIKQAYKELYPDSLDSPIEKCKRKLSSFIRNDRDNIRTSPPEDYPSYLWSCKSNEWKRFSEDKRTANSREKKDNVECYYILDTYKETYWYRGYNHKIYNKAIFRHKDGSFSKADIRAKPCHYSLDPNLVDREELKFRNLC